MAINFPNSPVNGDVYTEGNRSWTWNGVYWRATSVTLGYTGSRGYAGSIGYSGSAGDPGAGTIIKGSVASSSLLDPAYQGDIGDAYIASDTGHLWVWDGAQWYDVGQVAGYSGSLGYTGSRGALDAWTYITANTTANSNARYIADTTNGQFTVTLPANPTLGYYVVITDGGAWNDTPLLVDGNGETIEGYTDQIALDVTGITVEFIWNPDNWEVTATLGVRGDLGYTGSQGPAGEFAALGYTGSAAALGALDQSLIPDGDDVYDLGSADYKWRSLYVGANTIYLGTSSLSIDDVNNQLVLTNSQGEPVSIGGASVEVSDTAPADPDEGNMWLDSTSGNFSVYVGGGWLKVGPGGGGSASVEVAGTAPSSPDDGNMWMNDETGEFSVYVGGGWLTIAGGGGGAGGGTSYDEPAASTGYFGLPVGTTAQRPGTPAAGMLRYNSTTSYAEIYTAAGWAEFGILPPTITGVAPNSFNGDSGTVFTVTGSGFASGAVVNFITSSLNEYAATTTVFVNPTSLLATTSRNFTVDDEPLSVKVTNPTGSTIIASNVIDCGSTPSFDTVSGSLGTLYDHQRSANDYNAILSPVTATEPDGATLTYSVASGTLPPGMSLSSSTGAFSGTIDELASDTTYSFTIGASDGVNINTRSFSITVLAPITVLFDTAGTETWTAPAAATKVTRLIMIGGGGGGSASNGLYGSSAGGAGYVDAINIAITGGNSYEFIIGAGGLGAVGHSSSGVAVAGSNGGNTTAFGATAYGGGGGAPNNANGGGPGGSFALALGMTDNGSNSGTSGVYGASNNNGGAGGNNGGGATYGTGAAATGNFTPGNSATGFGNGAGGGSSCQNWVGTRSGNGSGGLISITY